MPEHERHDPVADPAYPRITEYDPATDPEWPEQWGSEPTERDQAAIDARAAAESGEEQEAQ